MTERPTTDELKTTIRTLDWLRAIVSEQAHAELAQHLHVARAFAAATLAHN